MKKVMFTAAFMLAMGFSAVMSASENVSSNVLISFESVCQANDMPQAVKDAVAAAYPEMTVKNVEIEETEGVKLYRLTLLDKDGKETSVVFNEKGEEQK